MADGRMLDASPVCRVYDGEFYASGGLDRLVEFVGECERTGSGRYLPEGVRLEAPVARPSKIVCVGLNYRAHAEETGAALPREPVLFLKATSAWSGPYDDLVIPEGSEKTDWEVELAVVIGRKASRVPEDRALEYVAGYGIMNDYSEREWQKERGGQWTKGKSADTFAPFGPWLVTRDELPDPGNLALRLTVNGAEMQHGTTADLIFPVPFLISYISRFMTLLPGDIISTGTPAGVGLGRTPPVFLRPGDVIESTVTGLGRQMQRAVAAGTREG